MTDDPSLSDEGYVAALAGGAALLLALLAAAGGEAALAVVPALLSGALGLALAARDAARDRPPTTGDFLTLGALAAIGAAVSLQDGRLFTASGLGAVALMGLARGVGWWVGEDADADVAGETEADE